MDVYVFRGRGRIFAITRDPAGSNLPCRYAPWSLIKTALMRRDEPHSGVDVTMCISDIEAYGFHITDAHERITPQVVETSSDAGI